MKKIALLLVTACSLVAIMSACKSKHAGSPDAQLRSYDVEQDPNDPQHLIPLNYQQAQGKRVFNNTCVWCHADVTPAGPSNRPNLTPQPPLATDGETLNNVDDETMRNVITLGGSAMGKSPMMPPWGQTLSQDDIKAVMAYVRVLSQTSHAEPQPKPETDQQSEN